MGVVVLKKSALCIKLSSSQQSLESGVFLKKIKTPSTLHILWVSCQIFVSRLGQSVDSLYVLVKGLFI